MSHGLIVPPAVTRPQVRRIRGSLSGVIAAVGGALLIVSIVRRGDESLVLASAALWALTIGFALSANCMVPSGTRGFTTLDPLLGLAFLFGVALPTHNVLVGPPLQARGAVSTDWQAAQALAVSYVFFVVVLLGWAIARPRLVGEAAAGWAPRGLAAIMVILGVIGAALRYRSAAHMQEMATVHAAGVGDLLGTMFAPLLAVGAFFTIFRPGTKAASRVMGALLLAPPSIYALSTYALNRAIFVVPAIAMFIVLVRAGRVRRVAFAATVLIAIGAVVFLALGQARLDALREKHGSNVEAVTSAELAQTSLQVYGQSPYLTGGALESSTFAQYPLRTPLYSVLSPLPRLGEGFRTENGTRLFNASIGRAHANDQIIPVWLEVYLSGGLWLLAAVGMLVGVALVRLDNVMRRGRRSISVYAASLASLWVAQSLIVSLLVLSQIFIYFVLPLVCLGAFEGRRQSPLGEETAQA